MSNVKVVVKGVVDMSYNSHLSEDEKMSMRGFEFHDVTMRVTHPRAKDIEINSNAEKICLDACQSEGLLKIMRSIDYRLMNIPSKQAAKALSVLHILLLSGPEAVLSGALDLLPKISASIDHLRQEYRNSATLEYLGSNSASSSELRTKAQSILELLLDHNKLYNQRKWSQLWRLGAFPHMRYTPMKTDLLEGSTYSAKTFPSMDELHANFRPPGLKLHTGKDNASAVYLGAPRRVQCTNAAIVATGTEVLTTTVFDSSGDRNEGSDMWSRDESIWGQANVGNSNDVPNISRGSRQTVQNVTESLLDLDF